MYGHFHKKPLVARLIGGVWQFKWASVFIAVGLYLFASSGYIHAKAMLAQYLIADAWQASMQVGSKQTPWFWADTYPVAKLIVGSETRYVLAGASGRTLAFGPGHMSGTALPGEQGNAVISGHRDTHFAILESVQVGDSIYTETNEGKAHYQVVQVRIVDQHQMGIVQSGIDDMLTLITCYPFKGINPNPELRYVVRAVRVSFSVYPLLS